MSIVLGLAAALMVLWAARRSMQRRTVVDALGHVRATATSKGGSKDGWLVPRVRLMTSRFIELDDEETRTAIAVVAVAAMATFVFPPALVLVPATWLGLLVLQRHNRRKSRQRVIERDLPMVVDLMRLAVSSGLNVSGALIEVCAHLDGPLVAELRTALLDVERGRRLSDALDAVVDRAGNCVRPLIWSLVSTERYGAPLSDSLVRLAHETRVDQEQRAEQAARRLSVQMLFPVAGLILPAFALLTVVPLFAGALSTLASTFH